MKTIRILIAASLCAALGGSASAGYKQVSTVTIFGSLALGALGDARASANTVEYIGCSVTGTSTASPSAVCSARDASGTFLTCSSSVASLVEAASNVGPNTYMYFAANTSGQCTGIAVYNYSYSATAP